jgi:predicted RNase H-like nuclease (RuvC/YqgF family)
MGARKMTDLMINQSVMLLDGWAGKLTWDLYLEVLAVDIGHRYTKAAMLRHPRIKDAWDHAKERCRDSDENMAAKPPEVALMHTRNSELEQRVERLTRENQRLLEQFVRWAHNASRRGMSLEELERPLPYVKTKELS